MQQTDVVMRVADWVSLFGLISGPVFGVVISLVAEKRRANEARRADLLRNLLVTRQSPAEAGFYASINAVPLIYKNRDGVLAAHETFMAAVNRPPLPAGADLASQMHVTDTWREALNGLLRAMLKVQGYKDRAAQQIVRSNYDPSGAVAFRDLQGRVLQSVIRVADAVERSAAASEALLGGIQQAIDTRESTDSDVGTA